MRAAAFGDDPHDLVGVGAIAAEEAEAVL